MRSYKAFLKKEWMETVRSWRIFILGLVFLLIGAASPLTAKYLPEIVSQFMPAGMSLEFAAPAAEDAWLQFFKNSSQIGLVVFLIMYSGMFSGEYARGTLVCVLAKGLPRRTVVLAKFTSAVICWSGLYLGSAAVCFGYTWFFWDESVSMEGLPLCLAGMWVLGFVLLAVLTLGGSVVSSACGSLLFAGVFLAAQFAGSIFPRVAEYMPVSLAAGNAGQLNGAADMQSFSGTLILSVAVGILALWAAVCVFERRKLLLL